jgi:hypothetical protein
MLGVVCVMKFAKAVNLIDVAFFGAIDIVLNLQDIPHLI